MSRKGKKAFRACDVKTVEFGRRVQVLTGKQDRQSGHESFIILDDQDMTPEQKQTHRVRGYNATLHCPRTDDDERVKIESRDRAHPSQLIALKSVEELAGELLCKECQFASMTPVEVSEYRRSLAEAEAKRVEAYGHLLSAREELASLDVTSR